MSQPLTDDEAKEIEEIMTRIDKEEGQETEPEEEEENIDWDEEDGELPEYYQGIEAFNPTVGIIEKPSVFRDTAEAYGKIVKKEIRVDLEKNSKESESIYSYSAKSLVVDIPAEGTKIIKDEGQLLEWYLKRPIFRLLAKSDDRNKNTIYKKLESDGVINWNNYRGTSPVLDTVYNLVEYHRCEAQQGRIFIGSKQDIDDIYSRVPEKAATNQIETLINTKCGRDDLIPQEFKEDARFYKNELKKVEGASAIGTMIATRNIVTRIVQKTKLQEPEKEPEPEPEGEEGEGEGQDGTCRGDFPVPSEPKGEQGQEQDESEDESEQDSDSDSDSEDESESESESEQEEQKQPEPEQTEKEKHDSDYKQGQILRKQTEDAVKDKDTLNLDRATEYGGRKIKTTEAKIDWEKPEQEILNDAYTQGERQIQNVKKIFQKIALEQKEKILKKLQETKVDNFDKDRYGDFDIVPCTADKPLVNKLAETFARIKTRRSYQTADSGIRVNVDNYIRRYAGDDKVKLFERRAMEEGLDIAYVIDCSGSMSYQSKDTARDVFESRIRQAKRLLLTMTEATKNLKNVNNTIFAYGFKNDTASIVKQKDINSLKDYGGTPSHIGLYHAMKHLKKLSNRNRKLIIHITDGGPDDSNLTEFAVNQIKQQGIEIHTILLTEYEDDDDKSYERTYGGKNNFTKIGDFGKVRQIVSTTVAKRILEILT